MNTHFISDDGVKDDGLIKIAGKYAEGVFAVGPRDLSRNPMAEKANEDHGRFYNSDSGPFFLNAYAAALAIFNAIGKAGSTDCIAIAEALRTEHIYTPLGNIRFDGKGDIVGSGFSMYQVKNGAFVELI